VTEKREKENRVKERKKIIGGYKLAFIEWVRRRRMLDAVKGGRKPMGNGGE